MRYSDALKRLRFEIWRKVIKSVRAVALIPFAATLLCAQAPVIRPGAVWLDDRGRQIQAHGGGMIRWKGLFYWFGEDRTQGNDPERRYVACYSSSDLVHWKFRRQAVALVDPEHLGPKWILERPKVFHNARSGKFVMYAHLDNGSYGVARVAVLVSDRIDGDYHYVKSFRPLGEESRDIGQFIDDDGAAYLIFESRPTKGFFIARLSRDYLSVEERVSFLEAPLEGGALVHYLGLYYAIGSHLTGWNPNPNVYATALSLSGPSTEFKNIAPPDTNTYGSQSTMLLKIAGSRKTSVLYMGDIWRPNALWDSRYLWMPLEIGNGNLHVPPPHDWTLDVETGEASLTQ
jgi:Glycosyl hydrolases family 43